MKKPEALPLLLSTILVTSGLWITTDVHLYINVSLLFEKSIVQGRSQKYMSGITTLSDAFRSSVPLQGLVSAVVLVVAHRVQRCAHQGSTPD